MIKMDCTQGRQESLAAFLARVRPGGACACCGATLRALDRGSKTSCPIPGAAVSGLRLAVAVVICPECGCEVSEEAGPDAEEGLRELSSAA